ncbi:MAG: hypothetical protein CME63_11350 [Halobacteriovoraceae bacterium]|nr:hypothetical protein [Halobacteriovoraceae bacterium]MBC98339.1 hypothetical protein [Halobacteriovoraceae bacterium]
MKIVIVDDSVVFRMALKQALGSVEGIEVVAALSNGQLAVDYLENNKDVDLITLDMEMPVLDGMGAIVEIRKINKFIPIIVFSSLTTKGAEKTIEALNRGANDFVTKEEVGGAKSVDNSIEMIKQGLLPKIQAFHKTKKRTMAITGAGSSHSKNESQTPHSVQTIVASQEGERKINVIPEMTIKPKLIVMASSTGGPEALTTVFKNLNEYQNNLPILLVQHMPPLFTAKLAEMLTRVSPGYKVIEAKGGERLERGVCYIAPGDYHMRYSRTGLITLDQEEKNCFVRPAANCLFESVAANYDAQVASIVLTGMGEDGGAGVLKLSEKGSYNFYQSERTCTVYGMPAAISRTGKGYEIDLEEVPKLINQLNSRL